MEAKSVRRGSRTGKIDTSNRVAVRSSLRPSSIQPHFGRRYLRIRNTSLGTGLQSGEYPFSPRVKSSGQPTVPLLDFRPNETGTEGQDLNQHLSMRERGGGRRSNR